MSLSMFCYQCQEAAKNEACTVKGVCGKDPEVAALQDLTIHALKGLATYAAPARALGIISPEADLLAIEALFATITNVSFAPEPFEDYVERALALRNALRARWLDAAREAGQEPDLGALPDAATWQPESRGREAYVAKGLEAAITALNDGDEDVRSLRELLIYGLKGLAAYADHAHILDQHDVAIMGFVHEALALTAKAGVTADELLPMVLRCGEVGVQTMALLDQANTAAYGNPEPTQVNLGVREGPAILVSGHDLRDLDEILQQTAGKGINVYTHGEMLPAHAYPRLKAHSHLVGNYGGSWWQQNDEFQRFGGAIVMTTNCLVPPRESYRHRLFTSGIVSWPGVQHIGPREPGGQKDWGAVIEAALASGSPEPLEEGSIPVGYAHAAVLSMADRVIEAIQNGAIKQFVVMAGCDGRQRSRAYFTDVAEQLPNDTVILTAGCAKYRYNKLPLGDIGGIPRVLDAGQCNDSYSLVVIAQKLAEALGIEDINQLPIAYDIAWYEQKAVLVLLALLSLGVRNIRLGPTLPAFLSPGVAKVLVKRFGLAPTSTASADVQAILATREAVADAPEQPSS